MKKKGLLCQHKYTTNLKFLTALMAAFFPAEDKGVLPIVDRPRSISIQLLWDVIGVLLTSVGAGVRPFLLISVLWVSFSSWTLYNGWSTLIVCFCFFSLRLTLNAAISLFPIFFYKIKITYTKVLKCVYNGCAPVVAFWLYLASRWEHVCLLS